MRKLVVGEVVHTGVYYVQREKGTPETRASYDGHRQLLRLNRQLLRLNRQKSLTN